MYKQGSGLPHSMLEVSEKNFNGDTIESIMEQKALSVTTLGDRKWAKRLHAPSSGMILGLFRPSLTLCNHPGNISDLATRGRQSV